MTTVSLTCTRIHAGTWEGVLSAETSEAYFPELTVSHHDVPLDDVTIRETPDTPNNWTVRIPIPAERLADGVQTFVITDAKTGDRLDSFTIIAGEPLADDLRAEIDLLRAELDLLKRAFRRHCLETSG